MGNPKVSIIVPVYKVEKYIHRCMDSILSQTLTEFECILVDDCSPDNCPQICDDYAIKDERVKVIHKTENESLPQARKTGFENSTGEYIQFVDSDDWIEPDMVEKLYVAAKNADADIVACDYYINNVHEYRYEIQTIDTENIFNNLGFIGTASVWSKLFSRNIIACIQFPKTEKYEDRVITQQAFFYARKILKVSIPLYHYCYNGDAISYQITPEKYIKWRNNILFIVDFLVKKSEGNFTLNRDNICNYVNKFKFKVLKNRLFLQDPSLLFFYPESKFFRWFLIRILQEIPKFIIPYGIYNLYLKSKQRAVS